MKQRGITVRGNLYGRRLGRPARWPTVGMTAVSVTFLAAGARLSTTGPIEVAVTLLTVASATAVWAVALLVTYWQRLDVYRVAQQSMSEIEAYANRPASGGDRWNT